MTQPSTPKTAPIAPSAPPGPASFADPLPAPEPLVYRTLIEGAVPQSAYPGLRRFGSEPHGG